MVFIGSRSRLFEFREDFIKDTGLPNVEDNLQLYMQYVTARFSDQNHKLLVDLLNEMRELQKNVKKL
ncbi:MAG TPA: hypothetical protein VK213_04565 [Bacteroidales bacterium]|nr:hypothetical protein [Bacteroidales bacterium]